MAVTDNALEEYTAVEHAVLALTGAARRECHDAVPPAPAGAVARVPR